MQGEAAKPTAGEAVFRRVRLIRAWSMWKACNVY